MTEIIEEQHLIEMEGGGRIALYRYEPQTKVGRPLLITHGTLSDMTAVRDLAKSLVKQGFDCWILEWGGHGKAIAASSKQTFEYPAMHDGPEAIAAVLEKTGHEKLYWVSHSGGGHLLLMHLGRHPEKQTQIAGAVLIGAQATDATLKPIEKWAVRLLWLVTMVMNQTPLFLVRSGTEAEPTRLLAQWAVWSMQEKWLGADGFDYLTALSAIKIPALIMAGGADRIAPASGCRKFFDQLGSADKSWVLCSAKQGFSKDFSHGQLIRGRAARQEVFPKVLDWLKQHNHVGVEGSGSI